jgi:inhibitor of KinA sporulation pathway (predicted exonuclease)
VEATRSERDPRFQQEIIELPAVLVDLRGKPCIAAIFHTFVRPTVNPKLNYDTTSFMPIRQTDVDAAPPFETAFRLFKQFVEVASAAILECGAGELVCKSASGRHASPTLVVWTAVPTSAVPRGAKVLYDDDEWSIVGVHQSGAPTAEADAYASAVSEAARRSSAVSSVTTMSRVLAACDGPWDITCYIAHECARKSIASEFPRWMTSFWNTRKSAADGLQGGSYKGLRVTRQLQLLGMSFWGTEHSGLDDTINIARIAIGLLGAGRARATKNDSIVRSRSTLTHRWVFNPEWLDWGLIARLL